MKTGFGLQLYCEVLNLPSRSRLQQTAAGRTLLLKALDQNGLTLPEGGHLLPFAELSQLMSERLGLYISIAHCSGLVCLALSESKVGVDCDAPRPGRNWREIAEFYFSSEEVKEFEQNQDLRETSFLISWTIKEAFIKLTGASILTGLNSARISHGQHKLQVETNDRVSRTFWTGFSGDVVVTLCCDSSVRPAVSSFSDKVTNLNLVSVVSNRK